MKNLVLVVFILMISLSGAAQESKSKFNIPIGKWNAKIMVVPHKSDQPLRWQRPRMIFVNSMSDLFHEDISEIFITAILPPFSLDRKIKFMI